MEMKKLVLKLDLHDDKDKQKAMKAASSLSGIDSIAMDMKDKKLTVIGSVDPVTVVKKLRKIWHAELLTVGPAKEEKKTDKKDEGKKDGGGGAGDGAKKDDDKKKEQELSRIYPAYPAYNNPYMTHYYRPVVYEENPNSCVIC